jgi:hypothetical protein
LVETGKNNKGLINWRRGRGSGDNLQQVCLKLYLRLLNKTVVRHKRPERLQRACGGCKRFRTFTVVITSELVNIVNCLGRTFVSAKANIPQTGKMTGSKSFFESNCIGSLFQAGKLSSFRKLNTVLLKGRSARGGFFVSAFIIMLTNVS